MKNCLFLVLAACLAFSIDAMAQTDSTRSVASRNSMVTDQALGISFLSLGQAARQNENGYRMSLQSASGNIRQATAQVSVSQRAVVDLPGSYGGMMYLDEPKAKALLTNRVRIDTVTSGGLQFRREFWAVYAGMGAWEGVINCYAFHNGQYYVLSLNAQLALGKPGELVGRKRASAEVLRTRLANILTDNQEPVVQKFNAFLSAFQVNN